MSEEFAKQIEYLIEKHIPTAFIDQHSLQEIKHILSQRDRIGRKEVLIVAYLIGATADESNELLRILGYPTLYAKRKEDAIWRYMLNHRVDIKSIIDEIFPQNVDEI